MTTAAKLHVRDQFRAGKYPETAMGAELYTYSEPADRLPFCRGQTIASETAALHLLSGGLDYSSPVS
jgi:hypothetical protein